MNENIYLESLNYKIQSAAYHKQMSTRALSEDISFSDPLLAAGAEFIAMMGTLHSSLDVLAQWINLKYEIGIKEKDVSFKGIIHSVNDSNIRETLEALKENTTYLDDFCNYIKHRNIVKVRSINYFISPWQPCVTYDIEEFIRNGRTHPPQDLNYQLSFQYDLIVRNLTDITGVKIDDPDC
jgi:hypothetical protein